MPKAAPSARHLDPFKNFKFLIRMEGRVVAGAAEVSSLTSHPGSSPRGQVPSKFEPITLKRGVTKDPDFLDWANSFSSTPAGSALEDHARTLEIDILSEQGRVAGSISLKRCWVSQSKFVAGSPGPHPVAPFDALQLEHEGIEESR